MLNGCDFAAENGLAACNRLDKNTSSKWISIVICWGFLLNRPYGSRGEMGGGWNDQEQYLDALGDRCRPTLRR